MHDDTPEQIDHLIEVFNQLKEMVKTLDDPSTDHDLIVSLVMILIRNTKVPEVTILSDTEAFLGGAYYEIELSYTWYVIPNIKGLALAWVGLQHSDTHQQIYNQS